MGVECQCPLRGDLGLPDISLKRKSAQIMDETDSAVTINLVPLE